MLRIGKIVIITSLLLLTYIQQNMGKMLVRQEFFYDFSCEDFLFLEEFCMRAGLLLCSIRTICVLLLLQHPINCWCCLQNASNLDFMGSLLLPVINPTSCLVYGLAVSE